MYFPAILARKLSVAKGSTSPYLAWILRLLFRTAECWLCASGDGWDKMSQNNGRAEATPVAQADPDREIKLLRVVFWGAVLVEFAALALVLTPNVRLAIGAAALVPLIWIPNRLAMLAASRGEVLQAKSRRFLRLRRLTEIMLEEVRRLNGLTVDARRGVRDVGKTENEIQGIESRLHSIVDELRGVAGVEGGHPATSPARTAGVG